MESHSLIQPDSCHTFTVQSTEKGIRLDMFLVEKFPGYSRSFLQQVIKDGLVTIQAKKITKAGTILREHETVVLTFPIVDKNSTKNAAALLNVGIRVIAQEKDFAIIYKPAGVVVHAPSEQSTEPTLVDWLAHTFGDIAHIGYNDRPGIVHRLDKDTSGLMIIPLTSPAFSTFSALFKDRHIHKTYLAVVKGHPEKEGTLNFAIARHHTVRNKMTHHTNGRESLTHFTTLDYFEGAALVEARPVTGRTHQIRVHFTTIGHPLLGDTTYGSASPLIKRHALHAHKLAFTYNDKAYSFVHELPEDMAQLLAGLKKE